MEKKTTSLHYALNNPTRMPHLVKLKNAGLYVIYTRYCLEFLNEILKYPEFLRIIYNRGIDTCKHLVLLDDSMIERLNQERWTYIDFRPYMVDKERNLPPTGRSYNLYIKCPVTIPQDECVNIINQRLKLFAKYKVIPDNSWKIQCTWRRARSNSADSSALSWRRPSAEKKVCPTNLARKKSSSADSSPRDPTKDEPLPSDNTSFLFPNLIVCFPSASQSSSPGLSSNQELCYGIALARIMLQHDLWGNHQIQINCQWQHVGNY